MIYADFNETLKVTGWEEDEKGYLICGVIFARECVLPYINEYGEIVFHYRDSTIFEKEFVDSVVKCVGTYEHPLDFYGEKEGLSSENTRYNQVSHPFLEKPVKKEIDGSNCLVGKVIVTDEDTKRSIKKGELNQISPGMQVIEVPEEGEFNGQKYSIRQKAVSMNHYAHTRGGRDGNGTRLLFDDGSDVFKVVEIRGEKVRVHKDDAEKVQASVKLVTDSLTDSEEKIKTLRETKKLAEKDLEVAQTKLEATELAINELKKASLSEEEINKKAIEKAKEWSDVVEKATGVLSDKEIMVYDSALDAVGVMRDFIKKKVGERYNEKDYEKSESVKLVFDSLYSISPSSKNSVKKVFEPKKSSEIEKNEPKKRTYKLPNLAD